MVPAQTRTSPGARFGVVLAGAVLLAGPARGASLSRRKRYSLLRPAGSKHRPEKWIAVFGKADANTEE